MVTEILAITNRRIYKILKGQKMRPQDPLKKIFTNNCLPKKWKKINIYIYILKCCNMC